MNIKTWQERMEAEFGQNMEFFAPLNRASLMQAEIDELRTRLNVELAVTEGATQQANKLIQMSDALRAELAALKAQPVQQAPKYISIERTQGFPSRLDEGPQPVLYSDEINGRMIRRDDVWLALTPHLKPKAQPVQLALVPDLSMMVRRLVLSIRRLAEDDSKDLTFANACMGWLKAKGLAGSPLRDGPLEAQPVGYTDGGGRAWAIKWSGTLPPYLTLYTAPLQPAPLTQTCGVCGYTGNNSDSLGQLPGTTPTRLVNATDAIGTSLCQQQETDCALR